MKSQKCIRFFIFFILFANFEFAFAALDNAVNVDQESVIHEIPMSNHKELFKQLTEADVDDVTSRIHKLYSEFIKQNYNATFFFDKVWTDNTVNAYATRPSEAEFHVHVPGGIARAKGMTKDSLALILCHELGHHLGGAPKTKLYNGWPSAEGQADYWASSKCLKNYFKDLKHESVEIGSNIPKKIIDDCNSIYTNFDDMKICVRTILAGLDFASFLNQLPGAKYVVRLDTPDKKVVRGTNINDYPRPQCRFDTIYSGALCPVSFLELNSDTDASVGTCMDPSLLGARPRCWFAY